MIKINQSLQSLNSIDNAFSERGVKMMTSILIIA